MDSLDFFDTKKLADVLCCSRKSLQNNIKIDKENPSRATLALTFVNIPLRRAQKNWLVLRADLEAALGLAAPLHTPALAPTPLPCQCPPRPGPGRPRRGKTSGGAA